MLYTYYVYSEKDDPENSHTHAFVKFSGLKLVGSKTGDYVRQEANASSSREQGYAGVQLTLMRYRDFWQLIDPYKVCCSNRDVTSGACKSVDELLVKKKREQSYDDVDVYSHRVLVPEDEKQVLDKRLRVRQSGVYILMFSNCGTDPSMTALVSGTILVKNPYGFLPGNEFHKMPFYGWLSITYIGCAILWAGLSIRWWREYIHIQSCISGVIFLGLLECFLWYLYYEDWNTSGLRGKFLFMVSLLASVSKNMFSYMLVLVASLGWGVTRPYLDIDTSRRIKVLSLLYIILAFIREVVLSLKHSHSLSPSFVLFCLLPISLLNGIIFYWVFTALSSLIQNLKERGQSEKLQVFQNLWRILIVVLAVVTVTLLYQIFNVNREMTGSWRHQWLFTDGVGHILFLVILIAMMYLWAPHQHSQRYAYVAAGEKNSKDEISRSSGDIGWDDDDIEDGEGLDESVWGAQRLDEDDDEDLHDDESPRESAAGESVAGSDRSAVGDHLAEAAKAKADTPRKVAGAGVSSRKLGREAD